MADSRAAVTVGSAVVVNAAATWLMMSLGTLAFPKASENFSGSASRVSHMAVEPRLGSSRPATVGRACVGFEKAFRKCSVISLCMDTGSVIVSPESSTSDEKL